MYLLEKQVFKSACLAMAMMIMAGASSCNNPSSADTPVPGNGVTVITPNGGNTYYLGDTLQITWDLSDESSIAGLQIDLSLNGGGYYYNIALLQPAFSEFQNRKLSWRIQDSIGTGSMKRSMCSDSCRIFIHDYFNWTIGDVADKFFTIRIRQ
jgi:hypothetical protein